MSHEITIRKNGRVEFAYAGEVPWHGLGVRVPERMRPSDALREAGLEWEVRLVPTFAQDPHGAHVPCPDRRAVLRMDNHAYLGTVGVQYTPIQNTEQAGFIEALCGEGGAVVECAGSLFDGRRTFWTCKVPGDVLVRPGDKVDKYLIVINAHDGSCAFRAYWTPVRVVCNNTLNASLRDAKDGVSIRHTRSARDRMREAKRVLGIAKHYYDVIEEHWAALARVRIDRAEYKAIIKATFPEPDNATTRQVARVANMRTQATENLRTEARDLGLTRGTAWDAYNSVTRYTSHQMTPRAKAAGRAQKRFASVIDGNARRVQQRAWNACVALATAHGVKVCG